MRELGALVLADGSVFEGELFGADLPAILITADRSPYVRDEARRCDAPVLNKPIKPAALRALMAQWRVSRVAAAE